MTTDLATGPHAQLVLKLGDSAVTLSEKENHLDREMAAVGGPRRLGQAEVDSEGNAE